MKNIKQKPIKNLIISCIKKGNPKSLKEIYVGVKKFRPSTKESTIRGRINESILRNEKVFKRLGGGIYDIE